MDYDEIRALLTQARLDRNMSMEQVARRAGVSRQTINNWEKGRFRPANEQVEQWAHAFGWGATFLLMPEPLGPLLGAARGLSPPDQQLAAQLLYILPRLDIADRRTLQLLVDGWSQSSGVAAEATPASPAQRRARAGG